MTLSNSLLTVNGALTMSGDLQVDGGDIGIAADTDLIQLASGALTINGTVTLPSAATISASTSLVLSTGTAIITLNSVIDLSSGGGSGITLDSDGGAGLITLEASGTTYGFIGEAATDIPVLLGDSSKWGALGNGTDYVQIAGNDPATDDVSIYINGSKKVYYDYSADAWVKV